MGYEYDIFLSYRRLGRESSWVLDLFYPEIEHWLHNHLGKRPIIFVDEKSVQAGTTWKKKIEKALKILKQ